MTNTHKATREELHEMAELLRQLQDTLPGYDPEGGPQGDGIRSILRAALRRSDQE